MLLPYIPTERRELNMNTSKKSAVVDILINVMGTAVLALGIHTFTAPNLIAPGGVSGLAIVVNYLFPFLSIGVVSILINIPLFILGWVALGSRFVIKSLISVITFSVCVDILFARVPVYETDPMLAAIFGGVLIGAGQGLVIMRNASTGGTDILGRWLQKKYPHISFGKLLLAVDAGVVALSMIAFRSIEVSLYALICIFVSTKMIDALIYGADTGKLTYIISSKSAEIAGAVINKLDRSATFLKGAGAFSRKDIDVLLCAIRTNQFPLLKRLVHEIDPDAFMIVTDSSEVLGEGFKPINSRDEK